MTFWSPLATSGLEMQ